MTQTTPHIQRVSNLMDFGSNVKTRIHVCPSQFETPWSKRKRPRSDVSTESNGNVVVTEKEFSQSVSEKRMYFVGEISEDSLLQFAPAFHGMESEDSEDPINIFFATPGGDVVAGIGIISIIKASENPVAIHCISHAFSMGAIIMQAADFRSMTPDARMMIHEVSGSYGESPVRVHRSRNEDGELLQKWSYELIAKRSGLKLKDVEEMAKKESYLSAKECLSLNLIDKIIESPKLLWEEKPEKKPKGKDGKSKAKGKVGRPKKVKEE